MSKAAGISGAAAVLSEASVCGDALSLKALLVARAYIYTMAHKLTGGEPTEMLMKKLFGATMGDVLEEYAEDVEALASFAEFLQDVGKRFDGELLDEIKDEYIRTFIGPASLPAIPIASPYITKDSSAVQKRTLEVRTLYRKFGYEPKRLLRVPDDHISLLCSFMAKLAQAALDEFDKHDVDMLAASLREQRAIIAEHFDAWMSAYAKDLRRSSTSVLYPQFIEAFVSFIKADIAFLDEASYWVEENCEDIKECEPLDSAAPTLSSAIDDLASLQAIELFGLEENELVPYIGEEKSK